MLPKKEVEVQFEGRVWKEGKFWLVEVPTLDLMTQGKSRKEALEMVLDAVMELLRDAFPKKVTADFGIHLYPYQEGLFGLGATENQLLLSLALRRQRAASGLTIREVARRLGSSSPSAYARYEQGTLVPSVNKFDQLFQAVHPAGRGILLN